ncbi:hypothetical protein J1TS1_28550 [Shouchella clausii]|uniref:hypothetical protein n=1 Tax=Shouchella clausii TaxID=79880 RepID=UPI001B22AD99|nr:hypothetical protein [Shouchella clausii]GIN08710.1 hypothetical protein J1TS1_28550 [Shouchella clausii]
MTIPFSQEQLYKANLKLREENQALRNDLKEINQCVDSFYTKEEPRRLHDAPLTAFSGQIQVIDKISSLKDK